MAGAPRCCYRLAMAHEYLYIARRANVAQALLLAASALLPTLAASGPRKRRVETARRNACATTAPVKLFLRCHVDVGIDGYADRRPFCSRRLPIAGRSARVGCQSPDPLAALFLRSLRGAPSPFSTPPSPRYNRHRMDIYEELVRLRNLGQKCALATIVEVRGSIPSYESAKLLVREDGSMTGTIGGGCVEAEVWNAAREVIQTEKPKHLTFNLGQDAAYDNG